MSVSKAHPVAGWLRVEGRIYSATLDRILSDRDQQMLDDPSCSGLPPASRDWFWSTQLPALVSDPKIRQQAGSLIEQQGEIDAELAMLEQVLQ